MSAKRKNAPALKHIADAKLPEELATLITTTITKTKLWKSERAEIALELISHSQDALEAGRTSTEIIESFGDPRKVAKLLRRAAKRKRPLYWRTMRNIRRGIGVAFALIFVVYAVQLVRYMTGSPNITTNYAQIINAPNDAYSEGQKAWPVYKEVSDAWRIHTDEIQKAHVEFERVQNADPDQEPISGGFFMIPEIPIDHPHYEDMRQLILNFEPKLVQLREAAHRPIIGITLGFIEQEAEPVSGVYQLGTYLPPEANPSLNPTLIELILPHLGQLRQFAKLLYFDAIVAARDGDSERVFENLSAMLAITRQKSFDGTLISDLVNMAIANTTYKAVEHILNDHPEALSREHMIALSHELSLIEPALQMSLDGERMMFDDVLQRTYTDDGNGNGRLTKHGAQILTGLGGEFFSADEYEPNPIQILSGPVALTIAQDRKSQYDTYHSMMDLVEDVQRKGPQYIALLYDQEKQVVDNPKAISGLMYAPVDILLPALSNAVDNALRSHVRFDGAAVMFALEIYRIDYGNYPDTLDPLYPNYIPRLPEDEFNPGQTFGYIPTDSGYALYSVGSDGDDDDGTPPGYSRYKPTFAHRFPAQYNSEGQLVVDEVGKPIPGTPTGMDGDWILFSIDHSSNR